VLIGLGSINGERINRYVVNGGGFFYALEGGTASVDVSIKPTLSRRFFSGTDMHVVFKPILSFNPPLEASSDMSVRIDSSMEAIYGRTAYGISVFSVIPTLALARKASVIGQGVVDVRTTGRIDLRYVGSWSQRRTIHVSAGLRGMFVTPQSRRLVLPGIRDVHEKQKEDVIK
jgi:hypothetical protein